MLMRICRILTIAAVALFVGRAQAAGWPSPATNTLTRTDVEVLTTTLHAFVSDHYPRISPSQTTIVLPHEDTSGTAAPFSPTRAGEAETSPLLRALSERHRTAVSMLEPRVADGVRIARFDLALAESGTTVGKDRAYLQMWLPGYSASGDEAVVYVWSAGTGTAYDLDEFGVLYYLRRSGQQWVVQSCRVVWET
jgi:hypothetical protein